jgi:hypothetical protein
MLKTSDDLFQAFELHIRKPSFVMGNNSRYTMNIFKQMGLPNEDYHEIIESHSDEEEEMNLGAWCGPKEEVSAEPLSGNETKNFTQELVARGRLTTSLMRKTAELEDKARWGFKILGDIIYADKYAAIWPNATFILLVRDPRDHALSVMKLNEQRIKRGQQLFYQDYAAVAKGWRETIEEGTRVLKDNNLNHIIIRYEDLAQNPTKTLKKLAKALDIDLSNAEGFHEADFIATHTKRFKHHDNLKNPANTASINKWKKQMNKEEIAIFSEIAGDLMKKHHYEI